MIRVVLDSNVYISAAISAGGNAKLILELAEAKQIETAISPILLFEVERILRDKFRWSPARLAEILGYLQTFTRLIEPQIEVADCRDPDDNRVLECALENDAGFVITGDFDLLDMKIYRKVVILSPRQFLDLRPWAVPGSQI